MAAAPMMNEPALMFDAAPVYVAMAPFPEVVAAGVWTPEPVAQADQLPVLVTAAGVVLEATGVLLVEVTTLDREYE